MTKQIPQGYKKTKVGIIPEDWEVVKLSKIVQHTVRDTKKPDVGYWRLGLRSHGKGTFHEYIEDPKKIAMETLYKVNENDLIINITFAWEHAIAIANKNDHGKLVSHRFPTYQFINENYHVFYKYYVLQEKFRLLLENISPGGAGRNRVMSKKSFLDLAIICPPVIEQNKIAEILSTWDDAITKQKQLIEQKQVFKKGIMQQIFSQKLRFKDDNGNDYPAWQPQKLGDIAKISTGSSNREDSTEEDGKYTFFDRSQDIRTSNIYLFDCEAVIVAGEGQEFIPKYFIGKFDLHQRTYAIYDFINASGLFIYYYLHQNKNYFISQSVGSTVKSLRLPMFIKMSINLPTLEEQTKIADFLTSVDDEINKQTEILDQLKLQKQSLMQKLLTGQVRTKI